MDPPGTPGAGWLLPRVQAPPWTPACALTGAACFFQKSYPASGAPPPLRKPDPEPGARPRSDPSTGPHPRSASARRTPDLPADFRHCPPTEGSQAVFCWPAPGGGPARQWSLEPDCTAPHTHPTCACDCRRYAPPCPAPAQVPVTSPRPPVGCTQCPGGALSLTFTAVDRPRPDAFRTWYPEAAGCRTPVRSTPAQWKDREKAGAPPERQTFPCL